MKKVFLFVSVSFLVCSAQAQDIFKKNGFNKEPLTLSKGRYEETFTNKEVVQIGSVLLNTKTNKVVKFLDEEEDTSTVSFKAEYSSRWLSPDPLAEKYPWISPYAFCNNNPIRYIDPDGREIRVPEQYREQFMSDIRNVYGDKADRFSFNENGTLQLDGNAKDFTKGMTRDQKQAFKGLNKAMSDKQVTSVVYENTQDLTIGGETKSVDIVKEYGGGVYSKTDNMIVVAPNVGTVNVTLDEGIQIKNRTISIPTQDVQQNTTSALFHEIGERNTKNANYRGAVIKYENYVRKAIGLPIRPMDTQHSNTVKTITGDINDYLNK